MTIPIIGPSYDLTTRRADAQRTVNMFPVMNEVVGGKSGAYFQQVPGLDMFSAASPPPRLGLLDPYPTGLWGAYGRTLLRGNYYGPVVRIENSATHVQQDFTFVDNSSYADLNNAAIAAFLGASNGYIATWYDQSGNGHHQFAPTSQVTVAISSDGSVLFSGNTASFLQTTAISGALSSFTTAFCFKAITHDGYFYQQGQPFNPGYGGQFFYDLGNATADVLETVVTGAFGANGNTAAYPRLTEANRYSSVLRWDRLAVSSNDVNLLVLDGVALTPHSLIPNGPRATFDAGTWSIGWNTTNAAGFHCELFAVWERRIEQAEMVNISNTVKAGA